MIIKMELDRCTVWFFIAFLHFIYAVPVHFQHSDYKISHHMGSMKLNATPEGANFVFSGGELDLVLHPAHSIVKPVYHYTRNEENVQNVYPVLEHRTIEEVHQNLGELGHQRNSITEASGESRSLPLEKAGGEEENHSGDMMEYFLPHRNQNGYHNTYLAIHGSSGPSEVHESRSSSRAELGRINEKSNYIQQYPKEVHPLQRHREPMPYFQRTGNSNGAANGVQNKKPSASPRHSIHFDNDDPDREAGSAVASEELHRPPEGDIDDFTKRIYPYEMGSGSPTQASNDTMMDTRDRDFQRKYKLKHRRRSHHHRRHHRLPSIIIVKEVAASPSDGQRQRQEENEWQSTKAPATASLSLKPERDRWGVSRHDIADLAKEISENRYHYRDEPYDEKYDRYQDQDRPQSIYNDKNRVSQSDLDNGGELPRGEDNETDEDDSDNEGRDRGVVIDILGDEDEDNRERPGKARYINSQFDNDESRRGVESDLFSRNREYQNDLTSLRDARMENNDDDKDIVQEYNRHRATDFRDGESNNSDDDEEDDDDSPSKSTIVVSRSNIVKNNSLYNENKNKDSSGQIVHPYRLLKSARQAAISSEREWKLRLANKRYSRVTADRLSSGFKNVVNAFHKPVRFTKGEIKKNVLFSKTHNRKKKVSYSDTQRRNVVSYEERLIKALRTDTPYNVDKKG